MKCNIGLTDKMPRIVPALLIAGLGFYFRSRWGLLSVLPLLTGLVSFCPIYAIFGLSTSHKSVQ
jgi:Protein of unknown function (DUF2892)